MDIEGDVEKVGKILGKDEKVGKVIFVLFLGMDVVKFCVCDFVEFCVSVLDLYGSDVDIL